MTQAGVVDGNVPTTAGRMIRTDRYKYCVYAHGDRRESLVDLEKDPGEMTDLAADPAHHEILLGLRERLRQWGVENHDPLIATTLADDVKPQPFASVATPKNLRQMENAQKGKKKS